MESILQKKARLSLQAVFKDIPAYSLKMHGDRYMAPGIPDIIACINGIFIAIECKMWRGRPTEAQQLHLRDINRSGGVGVYLVWNKETNEYFWVPANEPFTYRAKHGWYKCGERDVEINGKTVTVINTTYIAAEIIKRLIGDINGSNASSD
mgnify:FL=1|tara:strand:+ start:1542 stop:1994 length:453 start_codon:yes stop_codon:yes gene_type:complete